MRFVTELLSLIQTYQSWAYALIFLVVASESIPFLGVLIPGATLIVLLGALSANGYFNLAWLLFFSSIGAIVGDCFGYWFGTKGTRFFRNENKFLKAAHLETGQEFFRKYGDKSILLGRFIGPIRSIVPFVAGLSRMEMKAFLLWNVIGGILWSFFFVLLGYFFGNIFGKIAPWWTRGGIVFVLLLCAAMVIAILVKRRMRKLY